MSHGTLRLSEPYRPRPIRFLELFEHAGWRIKLYGIAYRGERPGDALVTATREKAREVLPSPAVGPTRYGVGFAGAHQGRGANFVFVDWWENENELNHHVFLSGPEDPTDLREITETGVVACTWDLMLIAAERQAWVETVLANSDGPDLSAYLERRLSVDA